MHTMYVTHQHPTQTNLQAIDCQLQSQILKAHPFNVNLLKDSAAESGHISEASV